MTDHDSALTEFNPTTWLLGDEPAPTAPLDLAREAHDAGLSLVEVKADGSKAPRGAWRALQTNRADWPTVEHYVAAGRPFGVVCGAVSGNLEMLEFEGRAVAEGEFNRFATLADTEGMGDLIQRICDGWSEATPTGGIHLFYRCDEIGGNVVLARRPSTAEELAVNPAQRTQVLIETRGEGGFVVLAPAGGTTHPNGRPWERLNGGPATVAEITKDERAALFDLARRLDRPSRPSDAPGPRPTGVTAALPAPTGDRPGDRFSEEHTCDDVLMAAGWAHDHADDKGRHYTRPGKRTGTSAVVWSDNGTCTLFSTSVNAPQEAVTGKRNLTPWQLHVHLNHDGDFSAAAREEAARQRSGSPAATYLADAQAADLDVADSDAVGEPGGRWLFTEYVEKPALWGRDDEVLLAADESLFIAAPTGVGKTTLATLLVRGLVGLEPEVLGYPVQQVPRVLYLAMDRPSQIRRAMRRVFTEPESDALNERLTVRPGPLPGDLGKHPHLLAELAGHAHASVVFLDSVKDTCSKLTDDEAGGNFNRAVQACLAEGVAVVALHHQRKGSDGRRPNTLEDVYGSTWLTAGAGSVVLLWGEAGSGAAELKHLKSPSSEVGPLTIEINTTAGTMTASTGWDALAYLRNRGATGATTSEAAQAMTGSAPTGSSRNRARRRLDALVGRGLALKNEGTRGGAGGSDGARYFASTDGIEVPS